MNNTIEDCPKLLKIAREKALLCLYPQSLNYYQKVLKLIEIRMKAVGEPNLKAKWAEALTSVKKEVLKLGSIDRGLKILHVDYNKVVEQSKEKDKEEYIRKSVEVKSSEPPKEKKDFKSERFGNMKPFEWHDNKKEDEGDDFIRAYYQMKGQEDKLPKEHYKNPLSDNYKRPFKAQSEEKKEHGRSENNSRDHSNRDYGNKREYGNRGYDQDKRYTPAVQNRVTKSANENKRKSNQVPRKSDKDVKRNYSKPWQMNDKKQPEKKGKREKGSFLKFMYPDGNGPDKELIEMLEQEVVERNPNVSFDDIADLEKAKELLNEAALLPLVMPEYFRGIRRPWKGILLYGPPGTGKTMLAKALATQGQTTFFNVSASSIASKWRGESEKLVKLLFEMARYYAPTTIFIDEVDSIGSKRGGDEHESSRKVKSELLIQMDGANTASSAGANEKDSTVKTIMVLGATNRPYDLDEALRRRFEKRIYIPLPTRVGIEQMFKINLSSVEVEDNIDWEQVFALTEGYSGADIANVCREASMMQMRRKIFDATNKINIKDIASNETFKRDLVAPVTHEDLIQAIKNTSKTVSPDDLRRYVEWENEFKSA